MVGQRVVDVLVKAHVCVNNDLVKTPQVVVLQNLVETKIRARLRAAPLGCVDGALFRSRQDVENVFEVHGVSSRIMSDAFSPIMMAGALVLPEVMTGMIEASATRSPSMPWTRSLSSTTAIGSRPILQVPVG